MLLDFKKVTKITYCTLNTLYRQNLYKPLKGRIRLFLPSFNGKLAGLLQKVGLMLPAAVTSFTGSCVAHLYVQGIDPAGLGHGLMQLKRVI
jgi:hypothetical protein